MEFTKNDLQDQPVEQSGIKIPIPEGENTLWIVSFKTKKDKDGNKIRFPKKGKQRNLKEATYFYVTEFQLADKDKTGNILNGTLFWDENKKIDYLDFARAGNAEVVVIDEGQKTERYRMEVENRADDDTICGIVGRAVKVHITHIEKDLTLPKKDEAGNTVIDPVTRKWVMEVKKDSNGNPVKYIQEYITRDSNWRLAISKSDNQELFFMEDDAFAGLNLEEPELPNEEIPF